MSATTATATSRSPRQSDEDCTTTISPATSARYSCARTYDAGTSQDATSSVSTYVTCASQESASNTSAHNRASQDLSSQDSACVSIGLSSQLDEPGVASTSRDVISPMLTRHSMHDESERCSVASLYSDDDADELPDLAPPDDDDDDLADAAMTSRRAAVASCGRNLFDQIEIKVEPAAGDARSGNQQAAAVCLTESQPPQQQQQQQKPHAAHLLDKADFSKLSRWLKDKTSLGAKS